MSRPSRILIFHTAFIGDIVLTLPLAQEVRERWPEARIVFVAIPAAAAVLRNQPAIDAVVEYDKRGADRGPGGFIRIVRTLSRLECSVALVPHRSLRSALAVWCARIPRRIGFSTTAGKWLFTDIVRYDPDAHETERNRALLRPLGICTEGRTRPRLHPAAEDVHAVDALLDGFRARHGSAARQLMVALAPGSVWFTKRWPEEHFLAVARGLLEDGVQVALVGGADDAPLCARIARGCGEGSAVLNAAGCLSPPGSAELLRRCALLVSNDSAPMHLAGAVGTPVFAVFGATVPAFGFGPLGPQDRVFEIHGLPCRPCSIHGGRKCPIGTFVCMRDLKPASLLAPIREFLSQHPAENSMALTMAVSLAKPEDKPLMLAAEVIQAGGVIVYPTETLYGIGADARDGSAIAKVRALKYRTDPKPILVIVRSQDQLRSLTEEISPMAQRFIDAFWPGPLTLVFKASRQVPDLLSRGTGTIGVRIPSSPVCLRLLELAGCPLTSSSANLSGRPPLHSVAEIQRAIPKGVDLFLDGGVLPPSQSSTVLDVTGPVPRILRKGAVSEARLRAVNPDVVDGQPV